MQPRSRQRWWFALLCSRKRRQATRSDVRYFWAATYMVLPVPVTALAGAVCKIAFDYNVENGRILFVLYRKKLSCCPEIRGNFGTAQNCFVVRWRKSKMSVVKTCAFCGWYMARTQVIGFWEGASSGIYSILREGLLKTEGEYLAETGFFVPTLLLHHAAREWHGEGERTKQWWVLRAKSQERRQGARSS